MEHHVAGVVSAPRLEPPVHLLGEVGGGLSAERRIGRADPLPALPVARCTGRQSTLGISADVERRRRNIGHRRRRVWHRCIISGEPVPVLRTQLLCDPAHLRVLPPAVGIGLELAVEVALVESREPRTSGAVSKPVEPVAGEAGVGRAGMAATQRQYLAVGGEPLSRRAVDRGAGAEQYRGAGAGYQPNGFAGPRHLRSGTCGRGHRFRLENSAANEIGGSLRKRHAILSLLLLAGACKPPPEERQHMPMADASRGKAAIVRVGCASCHSIPGVRWPKGEAAPALESMAERAMIAGQLPNDPEVLAAFVRNAPGLVPGTTMPAMPLTQQESRDVAAYLYEIGK